jgi:hypothetical protein
MHKQVKTEQIAAWLALPFYEGLDDDFRQNASLAVLSAVQSLRRGACGTLTTASQVASWLENDYWPKFSRKHNREADSKYRHAGALAISRAVEQLRSGAWTIR